MDNNSANEDVISVAASRVAVRLIRTDEELTIARAAMPRDERRRRASCVATSNDTAVSTLSIAWWRDGDSATKGAL